jgi:hypothetical protein
MSTDLIDLFKALHSQVILLHIRWAQFLTLFCVSDERMQLLSATAPGFFRIVQDVLRDDAFISLSRLTDKSCTAGKPNLSLVTLVEAAEASGDTAIASQARALLNQLLVQVNAIRTWRNQWLAHTDRNTALSPNPFPDVKVNRGNIDEALDLTRQLMDLFAAHLSQPRCLYQSVLLPGNAEALIRVLEAQHQS